MKLLRFYPLLLTALLQLMPLARVVLTDQLPAAPGASILFKWAVGAFALMGFHAVAGASNMIVAGTNAGVGLNGAGFTQTRTNGVSYGFRITASEARTSYTYGAAALPSGLSVAPTTGFITGTPNFSGTANITLTISQAGYTTLTTNLALTLLSAPVITSQPANQATVSGGSATFSVGVAGTAPFAYQWFAVFGGATNALSNATNASITVTNIVTASNYFVFISNSIGRATSSLATLTLVATPAITAPPTNTIVTATNNASFSVTATGGSLSYQWRTNRANFTGATNATFTITNVPSGLNGATVDVVVTNLAGSVTSTPPAVLTVLFAPLITTQPVALTRPAGTNGTFSVVASGNPAPDYQWRRSGTNLIGQTNSSFTIANIQTADAGNYDVLVTNSIGATASSTVALNVLFPPSITNQPVSRTNVVGTTATFSVGASGNPPPNYQWRRNGTNLANTGNVSGATTATLTLTSVQLTNAGSYEVTVINGLGGVTSAPPAVLTVFAPPAITIGPTNLTVVAGSNALFTVTATGTPAPTFQWRRNGADIAGETTAALLLTNVDASFNGSAITVVASNTAGSVTNSTPAVLNVLFPPNISAPPTNLTVAAGSPAAFTVTATGNPAPAYQWRKDGANLAGATGATFSLANAQTTNAGNYDVVVTNSQGSVTSVVATLTVNVLTVAPTVTAAPTNLTVLAGSVAAFSVTAAGTPPLAYQWRRDGADLSNETNVTLVINAASTNDAGGYDVVVANSGGSVTSAPPAVLTVLTPPSIIAQPLSLARFVGQSANFSVGAVGPGPLHFQWRFGQPSGTNNGNLPGETNISLVLTNLNTNHAGNYRVVVTNAAGATSSVQVTLTVAPLPLLKALGLQGKSTLMGLDVSPALPYNIEFSTNANGPWLPLTNLPLQSVPTNFTIPDGITNDTRRFYRVISP